jgi:imidazolonepropionase-like amidohydrolase
MLRVRTRREFLKTSFGLAAGMGMLAAVSASDVLAQPALQAPPAMVLFQNMRIFDGKGRALSAPSKVLVCGTKIERISTQPIPVARSPDTIIIDAGGLIPGLIDVHVHLTFSTLPIALLGSADPNYLQIRAAMAANDFLRAGYTSALDLSGPVFGMKRAIDEGLIEGPRIWPSAPMISQTSGHSDFRALNELPSSWVREPHPGVRFGYQAIADGAPAMLTVVRGQLMQGASQIKLAVGGGVSSNDDPIDVTNITSMK